jgi:hypothetical protein
MQTCVAAWAASKKPYRLCKRNPHLEKVLPNLFSIFSTEKYGPYFSRVEANNRSKSVKIGFESRKRFRTTKRSA